MEKKFCCTVLVLLLSVVSFSQGKAKIVFRDSEDSRAKDMIDKVVLSTENKRHSEVVSKKSDEAVFNLVFGTEDMIIHANYKFNEELPSGFFFKEVTIAIPFTQRGKTNQYFIHPLLLKDLQERSVPAIRNLWNTAITELDKDELLQSYQIAWALALHRTGGFRNGSEDPNAYDIQLAYRYMEIVRELTSRHDFVANKQNLNQAIRWFDQALNGSAGRVNKAIGNISNAKQMTLQAKLNEAYRFMNMWKMITESLGANWKLKYVFYKQYYNFFNNLDSNESRARVVSFTRVPEYEIVLSMGVCLDRFLNKQSTNSKTLKAEVKTVIGFIDSLASLTASQQKTLTELRTNLSVHLRN